MGFQILEETFRFQLDGCFNSLSKKLNQVRFKHKKRPHRFKKLVRPF